MCLAFKSFFYEGPIDLGFQPNHHKYWDMILTSAIAEDFVS